ncbi:penicillin-binding protein 1B [Neiella marina]|uniref:Penicillin-binding protein 1B n=1 Tax=Neiella holothuriorum TaxID=2870530 RepID=A0ABS7EB07_9GAMM|nr:penicillin-binding protein 1B [Neiella holothuriorum]MBW8189523.1 penicillin-binding protein 1B [Neiella holothuriorum]
MKWRERLMGGDSWLKWLAKIAFAGMALLVAYAVYLDSKLQQAFAELYQPHALSIQARPLIIKAGARLSADELQAELLALGYQRVNQAAQVTAQPDLTRFYRRAEHLRFQLDDRAGHKALVVDARFDGDQVVSLHHANQVLASVELAPVELDKIWAGTREDRIWVDLQQIPEQLIELLLMVEDRNFYQHWGVNPIAIGRALIANLQAGQTVQGGSTLTQQLAKNLLLTRQRSLVRKINEALLALLMEWRYSKAQILEAYINEIYMGQQGATAIHGFATASEFYFGRSLAELNLEQQVALVAMIKGPSLYNPWRRPETLAERRDLILRMLLQREQLDIELYQRISSRPVAVVNKRELQLKQRPAIVRSVRSEMQQWISGRYQGRLTAIATSIDPLSQQAMEQAARDGIAELEAAYAVEQLQLAMIAVDVTSGAVRALVSDCQPEYPGYNRVMEARRPIGSLLKPVILLAGFQQKSTMNLATPLNDRPVSMRSSTGKRWQPQNFDKKYRGSVASIDALSKSLNVPFVNLGMSIGLESIEQLLTSLIGEEVKGLYPSDLLGSISMSPWQVAQIFNTLANQGSYQPLHLIQGAQLTGGNWRSVRQPYRQQIIDPSHAFLVMYGMQQVVAEGTARSLNQRFPGAHLAAKTGTSNDYRDAWFVASDGREVVVIWVGRDDNQPINLTGSQAAMQLYRHYLHQRSALPLQLAAPADIEFLPVDVSGKVYEAGCPAERTLPFDVKAELLQIRCAKKMTPEADAQKPWWKRIFG